MAFEIFFKRKDSKFNEGILFQEYKDDFYLVAGGKKHTVYKRYCFPQKKDGKPTTIAIPISINLGNRYEAIEMFKSFLKALGNEIS